MITFLAIITCLVHAFHVSVSDIKYKAEKREIQISTRFFLDDIELALQAYTGNKNLRIAEEKGMDDVNQKLGKYLLEKTSLKNGKNENYELRYVGSEVEEDAIWCYMEVTGLKKLKEITIENRALMEVFPDQENLIHFRAFDAVKSAKLSQEEESAHFSWE